METLDELIRKIEDNLEEDWVKLKEIPKRCILKRAYDLVNVPGYFVTFYYPGQEDEEQVFFGKTPFGEKVYELFINNEPDGRNFHNGCSVLGSYNRIPDIIWFKEVHDKITILEGFYI